MSTWQEIISQGGKTFKWPYPLHIEEESEVETDVLVLGGGIAGCWAAISAARKGVRVALVEKGDSIRSGAGGPGVDHWNDCPKNPLSKVDADEWAQHLASLNGGYTCGIAREVQCRENYDTLLELEKMGGKVRDYDDEYVGAEGRDDKTKFMISPRANSFHETNTVIRVWGTTFKPVLKNECLRLGVKIYDRVMATSLLTEGGVQGARVVGATGVNNRTGEFMVFKSKATILCTAGVGSLWVFNTELAGITTFRSRAMSGDGAAMAWKAGAELSLMERSGLLGLGTGFKHRWYAGAGDASYENVTIVDNNGKKLPISNQGWNDEIGRGSTGSPMDRWETIRQGVLKGEYTLPFWGDFPGMPEVERRVTWGIMIGEEATTRIITESYSAAGFDPNKDMLQNYQLIEGRPPANWRSLDGAGSRGGIHIDDWNMKTTLDGLYATGDGLPSSGDHNLAASTGRYTGRKAADYAKQIGKPVISKEQVKLEKARVFAPIRRSSGIEWKELHAGIAKVMRFYCSEYKTESLLKMGLDALKDIEENFVPQLYAMDPHKLLRSLEDLSILTYAQIVINASLARKASSRFLDFSRIDYPKLDPPEWHKFINVKLENNKVKVVKKPLNYWGNLKENYEAYNKDYTGVYTG